MKQKKPKTKKQCPLKITEHQHQCKFFDWVRVMRPLDRRFEYIVSIPNAGKRSWFTGRAMKAEGLSAGFPDIAILHPSKCGKYAAAFLELKADYGYVTSIQEDWHERLRLVRCYQMHVCYGSEELIQTTKGYFGL